MMRISLRRRLLSRTNTNVRVTADSAAWGHSDSLDPDNVGDIADEGAGHRG
jgi:hypothetical protein